MAGVAGVREALVMVMREQALPTSIIESLQKKSNQHNIPYEVLETVYYRGLADFASGHRPTLTSQQWAFNRVNSYIHEGLTYHTADRDLAEGAMDVKRAQKAALQLHKKGKKTVEEDLRTWFKQKWVRMDTKGNIKGDCAREEGEGKPKCLPVAKARAMDKDDRAAAVRRKRREDPVADREGKGGAPVNVATKINEKNVPTSPEKWAQAKAQAKAKFDVYPSAYANGWAAKKYKAMGGGWKSVSEEGGAGYEGTPELVAKLKQDTPGESKKLSFKDFLGDGINE